MEAFDGLVTFFPDSKLLLNTSFWGGSELDRLPTTDRIIQSTLIDSNDGLGIFPYPSVLNLYAGGCESWDDVVNHYNESTINCSKACVDLHELFFNWQTLWNCLTLATMAAIKPYAHKYNNSNTTGDTARILDYLQVTNLTVFDTASVLEKVLYCANQTFAWTPYPTDYANFTDPTNMHKWGIFFSDICHDPVFVVDADLAGPGVLCSYILSIVIAVYIWTCIRVLHIANSIDWFAGFTRYKGRIHSFITFHRSRLATRIEFSTSAFAVDMQEAQCFFIFAVQIGLFLARSRPTAYFATSDWRNILYNRSIMKSLSVVAALPILLDQIILYMLHLDSAYSLSLCTIVMVMSYLASVASISEGLDIDVIYDMTLSLAPPGNPLEECSRHALRDLCSFSPYFEITGLHQPQFLMYLCLTVLILLWFRKLWRDFAGTLWLRNYAQTVSQKEPLMLLYMIQLGYLLGPIFGFALEVTMIVFMAINVLPLYALWNGRTPSGDFSSAANIFLISQVISVLIWAPAISKYIYLLIFGVERTFAIRISKAFAVIRKPERPAGQEDQTNEHDNFASGPTAGTAF